jgi:hypothetical protein
MHILEKKSPIKACWMLMCQVSVLSICLTRDKAQLRWIVMVGALNTARWPRQKGRPPLWSGAS